MRTIDAHALFAFVGKTFFFYQRELYFTRSYWNFERHDGCRALRLLIFFQIMLCCSGILQFANIKRLLHSYYFEHKNESN